MPVTDTTFNPSGDEHIAAIKQAALNFEQVIMAHAPNCARRSVALRYLETSSMYAVKAAAVGDN
jgi:hypothetical protein